MATDRASRTMTDGAAQGVRIPCHSCDNARNHLWKNDGCGHNVCQNCLENPKMSSSECQTCNSPSRNQLLRCIGERCSFTGSVNDVPSLNEHVRRCRLRSQMCSECSRMVPHNLLAQHRMNFCPKRNRTCQHCLLNLKMDEFPEHYNICPKVKIQCVECQNSSIFRDNMSNHLETECPVVKRACTYCFLGCQFKGNREALGKHLSDYDHVMEMMSTVISTQEQMSNLKKVVENLEERLAGVKDGSDGTNLTAIQLHSWDSIVAENELLRRRLESVESKQNAQEEMLKDLQAKIVVMETDLQDCKTALSILSFE